MPIYSHHKTFQDYFDSESADYLLYVATLVC